MPTEIKVPVVEQVNVSICSRPNSPGGSCPGVAGEGERATAREDGWIERPAAASKKRDEPEELTREGPEDRGRAAPTKRRRRGKTEHPDPLALGIYAMSTKKNAGKWLVRLSYLGRLVTLRPFDMEQALLVNRVLRGELEGKRNQKLTAEEIELKIKLAKEAALKALPEFKNNDNVDELVSTYSAVARVSKPPCDGTAPATCSMNLREHASQSRREEENPPKIIGLFGTGTPGKWEFRLGYGGRRLVLRPLTEEQALLANRVLREKLKPEMKLKTSRLSAGEIESNIAMAKEAALGALSKFKEGIDTNDFDFKVVRLKNLIDKHAAARRRADDSRRIKDSEKKPPVVGVQVTSSGKWRVEVKYYNESIYVGTHSVWEHAVLVNRVVREGLKASRHSKLSEEKIRSNRKLAMEAAMEALSDFKDGAADRVEALIARVQRESVKNQSCTRGERSDSDMPAYERIPGEVDCRPGKWQDEGADTKDFISKVESRQKNSIVEHSPARRRAEDSCQIKDSEKKPPVVGVSATASGKWEVRVKYYNENIHVGTQSVWEHAVLVNRVVREGLKASRHSKLSKDEIQSNRKLAMEAAMEALSDFKEGAADRVEALIARVQRESVKNQSCTRGERSDSDMPAYERIPRVVDRRPGKWQEEGADTKNFISKVESRQKNPIVEHSPAQRRAEDSRQIKDHAKQPPVVGVQVTSSGKWRVEVKYHNENIYMGTHSVWEHAVLVNRVVREGLKASRHSKLSKDEIQSNRKLATEAAMEALSDFKEGAADRVEALIARVQRGSLKNERDFTRDLSELKDGTDQSPIHTESHGVVATASRKWRVEIDYHKATHYIGTFESREQAMFVSEVARRELKATRELKLTADEIERNVEMVEDVACKALINRKPSCPTPGSSKEANGEK